MSVPPYAIAIVGERIATPPHLYANTESCPVSIGSSIISDRYAIRGPMIAVLAIMSTAGLAMYIGRPPTTLVRANQPIDNYPCVP